MSSEPEDKTVEIEIKHALASIKVKNIRPNKLRKIVCKKVKGTNWTQYQRVIDAMIKNGSVSTLEENGEVVIDKIKDGEVELPPPPSTQQSKNVKTLQIEVPFAIISYLTRKGSRKKKNIETNTKTTISFDEETIKALRSTSNEFAVEKSKVTITKTWDTDTDDDKEVKEKAKALLKTAKLHISKMKKSYKENPDHFAAKKAGGTFAEQDEAKKRKLEATKNSKNKYNKRKDNKVHDDDAITQKKKSRKFF